MWPIKRLVLIPFLVSLVAAHPVWADGTLTPAASEAGGLPNPGSEGDCLLTSSGAWASGACPGAGSGAPTSSQYWTGAADATLSAEKNLGVLSTGLVINTAGVPSIYGGHTCTNQVIRLLSGSGAATCVTITSAYVDSSILTSGGDLGTPSAGVMTNVTGLPIATGVSGLGTGVATFLATPSSANLISAVTNETGTGALVFATSPTLVTPILGTPTSATLTNATGLPISTGVSGLGTGVATALATPSSANVASAVTDETGTGALVFGTAPTISAAVLSTKVNLPRVTAFPGTPAAGDTVIVTDDSTAGACDSAAGSATSLCQYNGSAWVKLGDGTSSGGSLASTDIDTSLEIATIVTDETGSGALVFATSPTLVTPILGTPQSGTLTNATGLPISTGVSGLGTGVATALSTPSSANVAAAVTDETGTGSLVFANSPTLVTPNLGTPASGTLTNATGLPISTGVSGLGTGVATALATPSSANLISAVTDETGTGALVFATSPTLVTPALGTPSSGVLTNATGLPISTGVSGLGTGVATFLATPSSANLISAVTNETGTGALVFATSPTLVTPALGTPASGVLTNATGLPISTGVSGLGTGVATALATPSSANLASAVTDETGTGALVFGTAPTVSSAVLSTKVNLPRVTALPGTPSAGDTVIVTDDSATGACDSAAGSATTLCQYSGSAWIALGAGLGGSTGSTDNAVLRANGTGGSTVQSSGVTIDDSNVLTVPGGIIAGNGVTPGVVTLLEGTVCSAGASAGLHNICVDSSDSRLKSRENGGSLVNYAAASDTLALFAATTSAELAGVISNETGSGALVFATSPTLVTPALGTPSSGTLTNATGLPISTGVSGLGTGVATALATPSSANLIAAVTDETGTGALVFATSPTLVTPALGTPSSATLTNATGLPISTGVSGLGTGVATFLATPSSANLISAVTNETGTGALVFATSPTLVTPEIGAATATTPSANDNDTSVATTAYVQTELTAYASDTVTLTNKTIDFDAGAGNTITIARRLWFPAAGCNNATAGSVWDLPTTNAPAAACVTGTNIQKGVLDFDATTDESAQVSYLLPSTWVGAIDARVFWYAAATSGSVGWCVQLVSSADAETDDPAFPAQGAGNCVSDTTKGTTNQMNIATITGVTATGVAASELLHIQISRDANGGAVTDDMTGDARLVGVELIYRVAE